MHAPLININMRIGGMLAHTHSHTHTHTHTHTKKKGRHFLRKERACTYARATTTKPIKSLSDFDQFGLPSAFVVQLVSLPDAAPSTSGKLLLLLFPCVGV